MSEREADNIVRIFDTTLRDGEQSPGASMTVEQKVVIARQLEKLGVDVIEAGFAASSEGDFESVARVCKEVRVPRVLSLARSQEGDINRALKAVEHAKNPGIHVFIATSDIHLKHKLRMSREQVLEAAVNAVRYAKKHIDYIEFSAEDASRSDPGESPFEQKDPLIYRPQWTNGVFREMAFVVRVMCQDTHAELANAWRAIAAAPEPAKSQALAALQDLSAVDYDRVGSEVRKALGSKDKVDEVRMARHLGDLFRANYARAEAIAHGQ